MTSAPRTTSRGQALPTHGLREVAPVETGPLQRWIARSVQIRRMNTNDLIKATIERLVFEQGGALPDDWPSDGAERSNDDDIPNWASSNASPKRSASLTPEARVECTDRCRDQSSVQTPA